MIQQIRSSIHKARKEYDDDGWEFLDNWISERGYRDEKVPFSLMRTLVKAKNNPSWARRIIPGQTYQSQFNKCDGDAYYFRIKTEFLPFFKYDVYAGDY